MINREGVKAGLHGEMDIHSRKEYIKVLRERYLKAKIRNEKAQILDKYCQNTGPARKFL